MRTASIVILGSLALAACTPHQPAQIAGDRPSLKSARDALSAGEAGTSLGIARGILVSRPNDVGALVQAGDAEVALGDRMAAENSYRRALSLDPSDVRAHLGVGKMEMRDNAAKAERTFRTILVRNPNSTAALNDLGIALDLQGRHAEAQAQYNRAITVDPNITSARINLALSMALSGDPLHAEQLLRDAAEGSNNSARVRADFALAQVMSGHDDDAIQTLRNDLTPGETQATIEAMRELRPVAPPAK